MPILRKSKYFILLRKLLTFHTLPTIYWTQLGWILYCHVFFFVIKEFLTKDELTIKALVKSWVFEIKHIRNLWAHSENINYRLAFRYFFN